MQKYAMGVVLSACLIGASALQAVEPYTDHFDGPVLLDPSWTYINNLGLFNAGCYEMNSDTLLIGIERTIGQGDFVQVLEMDNLTIQKATLTWVTFQDATGSFTVFIDSGADPNTVIINVPSANDEFTVALGPPASINSLNVRVTWEDDATVGVGGSMLVEYELNDTGGYQVLGTILTASDASADRRFRLQTVGQPHLIPGSQIGMCVDYYSIAQLNNHATEANPPHLAVDVDPDTELGWLSFEGAEGSDVYFGTDETAVDSATRGDPMGVLQQSDFTGPVFELARLDLETTYYWRIDDIDPSTHLPVKGDIWSFTTDNHFRDVTCLDTFETYNTTADLVVTTPPADFRDQWGKPFAAAIWAVDAMEAGTAIELETTEVLLGSKAMKLTIDRTNTSVPIVVEARKPFDPTLVPPASVDMGPYDSLVIWAKGDASNTSSANLTLRVHATDGTQFGGVQIGEAFVFGATLNTEEWFPIEIPIDHNEPGWSEVRAITVGIEGVADGAIITMYFDRLCVRFDCGSDANRMAGDLDGDCDDDFTDLDSFKDQWLESSSLN